MDFIKKNLGYIVSAVGMLFILTSFVYLQFIGPKNIPQVTPKPIQLFSPTPSPISTPLPINIPSQGVVYQESIKTIQQQEADYVKQSATVGKLITKLPFNGSYSSMSYNFDTNQFTISLKKGSEETGNKEIDSFLSENGIQSRDWIKNLKIEVI